MQPDFFPQEDFSIVPEAGRKEPLLWVRRLVIWSDPQTIIREVALKPGLNIVWSPDPGNEDGAPIGHGSGKTTFCRFLRYCLGEDNFSTQLQRNIICNKLPNGHVGIELRINGEDWIVVRALGPIRRDVVTKGGAFEQALNAETSHTGINILRDEIAKIIIGAASKLMPGPIGEARAWEAILAWMSRDQECRFGHHLNWREAATDSGSPVRNCSVEDRLTIVRALIGALTAEEISTTKSETEKSNKLQQQKSELARTSWQVKKIYQPLAQSLGYTGSGEELDVAALKISANENYAKASGVPANVSSSSLNEARIKLATEQVGLRKLETDLSENDIRIEEKNKIIIYMRSQLPEAHARFTKERIPVCPICEVPIDKAKAEGCGISTATCDLAALQGRIAKLQADIQGAENELAALKANGPVLKANIALARQKVDPLQQAVVSMEKALSSHSSTIRAAQRAAEDVEKLEKLIEEEASLTADVGTRSTELENIREAVLSHRKSVAETVRQLSNKFHVVLRELIVSDLLAGEVKLDGNGLSLKVELGGERSTAAIESLKVVAFDLAALIMAVEGKAHLPGFLIHDSPREADLGLSIYHRLFNFLKKLQGFGDAPLFQYIVTTTTEPPSDFQVDEWLRLTIYGSPANERLLRMDL